MKDITVLNNQKQNEKNRVKFANETFAELQVLAEVEGLLMPMEGKEWDRVIELETDEEAWDTSLSFLRHPVNEIVKELLKDESYSDAAILPLVSVDMATYKLKLLILVRFDNKYAHDGGDCWYMKVYRKFYIDRDEYFYKNINSEGFKEMSALEIKEKLSEFEYDGKTYFLGNVRHCLMLDFLIC